MGHALLMVIVEPDALDAGVFGRVAELMEPFDQERDAVGRATRDFPCGCGADDETRESVRVAGNPGFDGHGKPWWICMLSR